MQIFRLAWFTYSQLTPVRSCLLLKYKNKHLASRNWILLPACKTQGIWFISTTHKWMSHNQINWKTAILQVFSIVLYTSFRRAEIAEWCSSSPRCAVILIRGSSPDPTEDLVIDLWWSRNRLIDQSSGARSCTCRRVFVQNSSEVLKWIFRSSPLTAHGLGLQSGFGVYNRYSFWEKQNCNFHSKSLPYCTPSLIRVEGFWTTCMVCTIHSINLEIVRASQ